MGAAVAVGFGELKGVGVTVGEGIIARVITGFFIGVGVRVGVTEGVGVGSGVGVTVGRGVGVSDGDGDGEGVIWTVTGAGGSSAANVIKVPAPMSKPIKSPKRIPIL